MLKQLCLYWFHLCCSTGNFRLQLAVLELLNSNSKSSWTFPGCSWMLTLCIWGYHSVFEVTTLYLRLLLCIWGYHSVFKVTTLYLRLPLCIWGYHSVFEVTTLYLWLTLCIWDYHSVFELTTLYLRLPLCILRTMVIFTSAVNNFVWPFK